MLITEMYKLKESKTLKNLSLALVLIYSFFILMLVNDLNKIRSSKETLMIVVNSIHHDIIYYFLPFALLYLIDYLFIQDIQSGKLKFILLRKARKNIILSKVLVLNIISVIIITILTLVNYGLLPCFLINQSLLSQDQFIDLINLLLGINTLVFTVIIFSLHPKSNFIGLIILHFIIVFLENSLELVGQYTYSAIIKNSLNHTTSNNWTHLLLLIILISLSLLSFERRDFSE